MPENGHASRDIRPPRMAGVPVLQEHLPASSSLDIAAPAHPCTPEHKRPRHTGHPDHRRYGIRRTWMC
ncbi:MAG: hypothetical protein EP297_08425 [Gammaproteobacteria bacterium]|nr:MAG: hypothetical protein EP297_08425 [Gammaproteobacteria bacterium]